MKTNETPLMVELDAAAEHLFEGLKQEYFKAVCSGRGEQWVRAGNAILELLADRGAGNSPVGADKDK